VDGVLGGDARADVEELAGAGLAGQESHRAAASSPSHVWLFGTDDTTGEPMILSHS
jgi:hypothetical protein